jgi:hypothetical protein
VLEVNGDLIRPLKVGLLEDAGEYRHEIRPGVTGSVRRAGRRSRRWRR